MKTLLRHWLIAVSWQMMNLCTEKINAVKDKLTYHETLMFGENESLTKKWYRCIEQINTSEGCQWQRYFSGSDPCLNESLSLSLSSMCPSAGTWWMWRLRGVICRSARTDTSCTPSWSSFCSTRRDSGTGWERQCMVVCVSIYSAVTWKHSSWLVHEYLSVYLQLLSSDFSLFKHFKL